MTPSSESTTTRTAMTTALTNNQSVPARSTDQHGFGVYQLTTVGASTATIRTLVPVSISAPPYRKALIAKLFLNKSLAMRVHHPSLVAIWSPLSLHISI